MKATRRTFLRAAGLATVTPALTFLDVGRIAMAAKTDEGAWRHGLSLFGDLKYAAQFAHFAYVNPGAPKGGTARRGATGTYDNFNLVVDGLKGDLAAGINLIYDTLLTPSMAEASSEYGLRRGGKLSA
jgi:microcin C transport system substrate-binding protein